MLDPFCLIGYFFDVAKHRTHFLTHVEVKKFANFHYLFIYLFVSTFPTVRVALMYRPLKRKRQIVALFYDS